MDAKQRAAFEEKAKLYTKAKSATREIARRTLIDQGIYTEDGDIAPEYGGEVKPKRASEPER